MHGPQAHAADQFVDAPVRGGALRHAACPQAFHDRLAHRHARMQRGIGILEHDLHLAAQQAHLAGRHLVEVAAVEQHLAAGLAHQVEDHAAKRRLARTGFAHQPQRLAAPDLEVDAIDGAHFVAAEGQRQSSMPDKNLGEAANLDQRRVTRHRQDLRPRASTG